MSTLARLLPASLRGYDRSWLSGDIIAGVTLAAIAIPECMGYTSIAQTPVVTGIYTIIFPTLMFALLGSSRLLVVGADSATAAMLAAGLAGLGIAGLEPNTTEWLAWTSLVALVCGGLLLIARVLKLGFLGDFLSASVLIGFLTGVGIQVFTGQIPDMLGIPKGTGNWFEQQYYDAHPSQRRQPLDRGLRRRDLGHHHRLQAVRPQDPRRRDRRPAVDRDLHGSGREQRGSRSRRTGAGRVPADRPARGDHLERRADGARDRRVVLRADHRPERRHVAQLRDEAQPEGRHQPRPRGAQRFGVRRRAERHLRRQRKPDEDRGARRAEGPHTGGQHHDVARRLDRGALPDRAPHQHAQGRARRPSSS